MVFFQDDPSDSLYIMLSGSAKVFQTSEDGKERILRIVNRGHAFGELAMLEGKSRYLSVQTLEPCDTLRLSRKDFIAFADKHTWVLWTMLSALAARVRSKNEDMLSLSFRDVPYRILHALCELVAEHAETGPDGARITMPLSSRELASMVGSNSETVGRLLDRFENDGLIKRTGSSWVVPDPKALNAALEYTAQQDL